MSNKHTVSVKIELDLKDEDALRDATALLLRPSSDERPVTWTRELALEKQLQVYVAKKVSEVLDDSGLFSEIGVAASG